jgi:hypothetical protein
MSLNTTIIFPEAIPLAERGLLVFPCHSIFQGRCTCGKPCKRPGKHPLPPTGLYAGSCDPALIRAIAEDTPWANIGIRTGPESGVWVLDLDGKDGIQEFEEWEAEHGLLPKTWTARSGSGGRHLYYAYPADLEIKNSAKVVGRSIDVRGAGGYIIAPPSLHVEGTYEWEISPG